MRSVSAILLALAAAAAPNIVNADFTVSAATTTQSGSTYVRQWTLTASGSNSRYIDQIKIEAPGQVFISYLSGQASGVAGYVNVTSSSSTAVDAMAVRTDDDDDDDDSDDNDNDELRIKFDSSTTVSDTLVTEIFLAQESTISQLQSKSSADVIVESGVIVASGSDEDLEIEVEGSGSVYVSDASAAISIKEFQAKVSGSGSLQVVVGSVALTEDAEFESQGSGGISLFASSLTCDELKFDADGSGTICIAAETITATESEAESATKVSLPNSSNKYTTTGSFTCTEASVPSRSSSSASSSSSTTTTTTNTTSTASSSSSPTSSTSSDSVVSTTTTPTPTPTPTPTNDARVLSLAAACQIFVLAVAAMV